METRPIPCGCPGCQKPATYKIAARWSDGRFNELKTYAFSCLDHFGPLFRQALAHRAAYKPVRGELLGELAIYRCGLNGDAGFPSRLRMLESRCARLGREHSVQAAKASRELETSKSR